MIQRTAGVKQILVLLIGMNLAVGQNSNDSSTAVNTTPAKMPPGVSALALTTDAFPDGDLIPAKYVGASATSPMLRWTGVPADTASFVLIFHDPDAALKKTLDDYLHWLLFNIPATARELPEGLPRLAQLPDGTIQVKTRGNTIGYLGPGAPAAGPYHHYTFDLYALDIKLSLGPDASREDVLSAINGHILGKAMLVGRFRR